MGKPKKKEREKKKGKVFPTLCICLLLSILTVGVFGFSRQKPIVPEEATQVLGIPYTVDTIPVSNKRIGKKRKIKYIVIHNTSNPTSTARNERDYLTNPTNTSSVSWHIAVDDQEAIEAIPLTEWAFHAGDRVGNHYGIGIEICESGDYEQAEANAAKVVAYLMQQHHIPIENVQPHQYFSGKECPRLILANWDQFIEKVALAATQL